MSKKPIPVYVTDDERAKIEEAATHCRRSLTEFFVIAALVYAESVNDENSAREKR